MNDIIRILLLAIITLIAGCTSHNITLTTELGDIDIVFSGNYSTLIRQLEGDCGQQLEITAVKRNTWVGVGTLAGECNYIDKATDDAPVTRGVVVILRPSGRATTLFAIITGETFDEQDLDSLCKKHNISLSSAQKAAYLKDGGAPHLTGQVTVVGRVISGLETLDRIGYVATDAAEAPVRRLSVALQR